MGSILVIVIGLAIFGASILLSFSQSEEVIKHCLFEANRTYSTYRTYSSSKLMPYSPRQPSPNLIPPHGGYRELKSFQQAELVYDATVKFCDRFIDKRSRTHDQMVQAARSGRQNIAEGSQASGTSKKFELKLVGVARASLEELLLDFEDFLRQRALPLWAKEHIQPLKLCAAWPIKSNRSYSTYSTYIEKASTRDRRQHGHLPDPPDQLPSRPAAPAA